MAEPVGTDGLRQAAPDWSLEGDKKLLDLLRNIHQNITVRCTETSKRLEEMVMSLDTAKVSIDNVNNRFISLSNTQFVESRVYDDLPDTTTRAPKQAKEDKSKALRSPGELLTATLLAIESNHERVTILDDSDSDTEDEGTSVILRPKDMYQSRPLPYIIGSQNWKNKWHAGLIEEDSDTDSMVSKRSEDYSISEESVPRSPQNQQADTNSFRSASPVSMPTQDQDDLFKPDMSRIYKPFVPSAAAPYFADEPPPCDNNSDVTSIMSESDTEDIFAELHKNNQKSRPKVNNQTGTKNYNVNINSDSNFNLPNKSSNNNNNKFDCVNERTGQAEVSQMKSDKNHEPRFDNANMNQSDASYSQSDINSASGGFDKLSRKMESKEGDSNVESRRSVTEDNKKPTGGVSLFGTKNAAQSIGAAILRRNIKKSTSSDEEDALKNDKIDQRNINNNRFKDNNSNHDKSVDDNVVSNKDSKIKTNKVIKQIDSEKDKYIHESEDEEKRRNIFEELFAKSQQNTTKLLKHKEETKVSKKVDLFSDIFDDIDDIFTSDTNKDKNSHKVDKKSIFDEDEAENDLFSDIVKHANEKPKSKVTKSIFDDDDDDLFADSPKKTKDNNKSVDKLNKTLNTHKETLFTSKLDTAIDDVKPVLTPATKSIFVEASSDDQLFSNNDNKPVKTETKIGGKENATVKLKTIFDSDSDDGDIFSKIESPEIKTVVKTNGDKMQGVDITKSQASAKLLFTDSLLSSSSSDENKIVSNNLTKNNKTDEKKDTYDDLTHSKNRTDYTKNSNTEKVEDKKEKAKQSTELGISMEDNNLLSDKTNDPDLHPKSENACVNDNKPDYFKISDAEFKQKTENTTNIAMEVEEKVLTNTNSIVPLDDSKDENYNTFTDPLRNQTALLGEHENIQEKHAINAQDELKQTYITPEADQLTHDSFSKPNNKTIVESTKPPADIFTDIFSQPPEIAMSKEQKSIQNVNALFGDDSEDENLFFKKEAPISDVKPILLDNQPTKQFFDYFRDEPPEFDDDFLIKPSSEQTVSNKSVFEENREKLSEKTLQNTGDKTVEQDTKSNSPSTLNKIKETLFEQNTSKIEDRTDGNTASAEPIKTVGKLKALNININVANLLPGATPKKSIKPIEEPKDSINFCKSSLPETNSNILINNTETTTVKEFKSSNVANNPEAISSNHQLTKSVSFDGDPESKVLDNKLSKQRAKIQIKRRPSTRQARIEAVRKSVISFEDNLDTVDCNESIQTGKQDLSKNNVDRYGTPDRSLESSIERNTSLDDSDKCQEKENYTKAGQKDKDSSIETNKSKSVDSQKESLKKNYDLIGRENQTILENKSDLGKKSKEIIQTNVKDNKHTKLLIEKETTQQDGTQVLNINDDDVYIFREPKALIKNSEEPKVTTLGQVYQNTITDFIDTSINSGQTIGISQKTYMENVKKNKWIFDDDDEDDQLFNFATKKDQGQSVKPKTETSLRDKDKNLFDPNIPRDTKELQTSTKTNDFLSPGKPEHLPVSTKPSIFDDDEILFTTSNIKPKMLPKTTKKSLFDDSDSDDDLFGTGKLSQTKSTKKASDLFSSTQNVTSNIRKAKLFEDGDTDLFSSASKTTKDFKSHPRRKDLSKANETTSELFTDPLSMFDKE